MAENADTRETLIAQVAELPGYDLRDGVLYYQGGGVNTDPEALRRILDRAGWPDDTNG